MAGSCKPGMTHVTSNSTAQVRREGCSVTEGGFKWTLATCDRNPCWLLRTACMYECSIGTDRTTQCNNWAGGKAGREAAFGYWPTPD